MISEIARWNTIFHGHCAYRTSNAQTGTLICKHLFTNTTECHFEGCPIVLQKFVAVQREDDTIYLVKKNSKAKQLKNVWSEEELPVEKEKALKVVSKAASVLTDNLKESLITKFEHLSQIAATIRETSSDDGLAEEDLELESEDLEDNDKEKDDNESK